MATIRKRVGKYGTTYRVEICVKGVRRSATFDSRSAAHAWAEESEHLLRSGQPLPGELPDGDRLFADAAAEYERHLRERRLKPATLTMYGECVRRLLPVFGERSLAGISRADVMRYRDARLARVGPAGVRHDFSFLRGLYKYARLVWGLNTPCPLDDVSMPAPPKNREPLLTLQEIDRLLDWCCVSESPLLYSYVYLLLHTAMRPSEAAGLRWDQVRIAERVILLTETKTRRSRRVPLTRSAADMLARLERRGELVFLSERTGSWGPASHYFRSAFRTACRRAGLAGITLYGLRHVAASYLIMGGVDIRTVAEIMGHSNISQTMRYTHLLDRHRIEAIQALDKLGG